MDSFISPWHSDEEDESDNNVLTNIYFKNASKSKPKLERPSKRLVSRNNGLNDSRHSNNMISTEVVQSPASLNKRRKKVTLNFKHFTAMYDDNKNE